LSAVWAALRAVFLCRSRHEPPKQLFNLANTYSFKQVSFVAMTHFSSKEKVMTTHRSEKDSMGAIDVPADKLWGAQTQRSLEHFRISTEKMPGADIPWR
jgi:hypothetical protein